MSRSGILRGLKMLFGVAAVCAFVVALSRAFGTLDWSRIRGYPGCFLAAVGFEMVNACFQFLIWGMFAGWRSREWIPAYRRYAAAGMSRYLPGGTLFQFAGLAALSDTDDVGSRSVGGYLGLTIVGLVAGVLLASSAAGAAGLVPVSILTATTIVGLSRPEVRGWLAPVAVRLRSRFPRFFGADLPSSKSIFLGLLLCVALCWFPEGLAGVELRRMTDSEAAWNQALPILQSYALASFGGYLAFFAPAGIGVREGLFAALAHNWLSPAEALFVSAGLRAATLLAEVVFYLPVLAVFQVREAKS